MANLTVADIRRIMRSKAGVDESVDLDGDILDTTFANLGYDSLAVMELAAHIDQTTGVAIPDGRLWELQTPRAMIDYVNADHTVV